ncbi:MAG TPA: GatB/YqeY domain-containing protein [Polyangiales bacterium]|nr:GatB/YqeY domain-containing protein [Polyangiales bacterium]
MNIRDQLQTDLKDAMRAKDELRLETVRAVRAAVLNREVELGRPADEAEILQLVRGLVKQRAESITMFQDGGRQDLVQREQQIKQLLEAYLPAAPDAAAITAAVRSVIAELGATSMKDMGAVMKVVNARLGAGADGKLVSTEVKAALSGKS